MKTLLLLLLLCISCSAVGLWDTYETYETNWTGSYEFSGNGTLYRMQKAEIKTNYQYVRTNVIFIGFSATNSLQQYPCRFQPQDGVIKTNIIINSDYKGTIQIGERFYQVCQQTNSKVIKVTRQVLKEVE